MSRNALSAAAGALLLFLCCPAAAAMQLRAGGDYLLDGGPGLFSLVLGADTPLAGRVSIGGRFGAFVTTAPANAGAPLDLVLRGRFDRAYLEGLIGPWIFFSGGDALRAHAAVGFGLVTRSGLELGLEVGSLGFTRGMLGARLGVRL